MEPRNLCVFETRCYREWVAHYKKLWEVSRLHVCLQFFTDGPTRLVSFKCLTLHPFIFLSYASCFPLPLPLPLYFFPLVPRGSTGLVKPCKTQKSWHDRAAATRGVFEIINRQWLGEYNATQTSLVFHTVDDLENLYRARTFDWKQNREETEKQRGECCIQRCMAACSPWLRLSCLIGAQK